MQVLGILINEFVTSYLTIAFWAVIVGICLGVATFDWRGWWERRPR